MNRTLKLRTERLPLKRPFRISGYSFDEFAVAVVEIVQGPLEGRGEAAGVFYAGETAAGIEEQIRAVAADIEAGMGRTDLLRRLPPGGARAALDCALWDLEAQARGQSAWTLAGVKPRPIPTTFTIGLEDTPQAMAEQAAAVADRPLLKIKLSDDRPVERVAAIREARPKARLMADCNGGWTFAQLCDWSAHMARLGVELLEQPLPRGGDTELSGWRSPVPLFADESCLHLGELQHAASHYDGIVIKLDKTGGLTEALLLAQSARQLGLRLMTGCMLASSLSMAPAHVLAQLCDLADIDAPLLLKRDREHGLDFSGGSAVVTDDCLWGIPRG